MPCVTVIKRKEFNDSNRVGTTVFPDLYTDITSNCDMEFVREKVPELTRKRIFMILAMNSSHPQFSNVKNEQIRYKSLMCASETMDGAVLFNDFVPGYRGYVTNRPVGDVVILIY